MNSLVRVEIYFVRFFFLSFLLFYTVCFFNPGLHRLSGFKGVDTWPETIRAAARQQCPIIVTSYTEVDSPAELERFQCEIVKSGDQPMTVVRGPKVNQYASQRPERNFISDDITPLIFKNYYYFVLK